MVPLVSFSTIAGIPLPEVVRMGWLTQEQLDKIVERTRSGGGDRESFENRLGFLRTGVLCGGHGRSLSQRYKAHFPCAAWRAGEYGCKDLYAGVPVIIGGQGVERVIELSLTPHERQMFDSSIKAVEELTQDVINLKRQKTAS